MKGIAKYPSISDRYQAGLIDILVLFALGFLLSLTDPSTELKIVAFICLFILYDPLFVSLSGSTLGHKALQLSVRKKSDPNRNISFPIAVIRFFLKAILGWISLITVSSDEQKRALHDIAAGSLVIYKK